MDLPRILTWRSGARLGLTRRQLRHPRFFSPIRGVFFTGETEPTLTELSAAALLVLPRDGVITGVTALWLHGIEIGQPRPIHAATTSGRQVSQRNIRLTRVSRLPEAKGRIARPLDAWLAAVGALGLVPSVMAADWLLLTRKVSRVEVQDGAAMALGRHCRLVRRAASLARERVDSPRETSTRLALVLAGLPEPVCNGEVGPTEEPIGRMDLVWEEYRTVLEYEGEQHRNDRRQWNIDIARHEALARAGYTLIRVTAARLARPRELVWAVYERLRERGYAGPPPTFSAEWSSLFELNDRRE